MANIFLDNPNAYDFIITNTSSQFRYPLGYKIIEPNQSISLLDLNDDFCVFKKNYFQKPKLRQWFDDGILLAVPINGTSPIICSFESSSTKEILFFVSMSDFPEIGNSNYLYVSNSSNSISRWDPITSNYIPLGSADIDLSVYQLLNEKGQAGGYTPLDSSSKIDLGYLSNYVLFFNAYIDFPSTGDSNLLYISRSSGYMYRWSGSSYIKLNDVDLSSYQLRSEKNQPNGYLGANSNGNLSPSQLDQDSNNRLVTDTLIAYWNAKANPLGYKLRA